MIDQTTNKLYTHVRTRGQWGLLKSVLTKRPPFLLDLGKVKATGRVRTSGDITQCSVPISQIVGSEGRHSDFDCEFNPLQERNRGRWLRIAQARERGRTLPPVDLVKIGKRYFVRDGHHRISVARALGQREIEARVVVWQVNGTLPWEQETGSTNRHPTTPLWLRNLWLALTGQLATSQQ